MDAHTPTGLGGLGAVRVPYSGSSTSKRASVIHDVRGIRVWTASGQ